MSRNVKNPQGEMMADELSPQQDQVIGAMLEGTSQAEAARLVGVAPETVSRWKTSDSLFAATLRNRRRQVWDARAQRLQVLADKALDVIEGALDAGDMKAAALVLKASVNQEKPRAETTPDDMEREWFLTNLSKF